MLLWWEWVAVVLSVAVLCFIGGGAILLDDAGHLRRCFRRKAKVLPKEHHTMVPLGRAFDHAFDGTTVYDGEVVGIFPEAEKEYRRQLVIHGLVNHHYWYSSDGHVRLPKYEKTWDQDAIDQMASAGWLHMPDGPVTYVPRPERLAVTVYGKCGACGKKMQGELGLENESGIIQCADCVYRKEAQQDE